MNTHYAVHKNVPQNTPVQAKSSQEHAALAQEDISLYPLVDIFEDNNGITLIADLPGVNKEALHIHVEGENLIIEGDLYSAESDETVRAVYSEVAATHYKRLFTLSKELDTSKIEATFNDGVLTLHIPKAAHAQPKKIEIKVA